MIVIIVTIAITVIRVITVITVTIVVITVVTNRSNVNNGLLSVDITPKGCWDFRISICCGTSRVAVGCKV